MSSHEESQNTFDRKSFAGRSWYYDFREVPRVFGESACVKVTSKLLQSYSKITKVWDVEKNTEWIDRLFVSAKLIMMATLHVNSLSYAGERNLRVVMPYLRYYAVLSLVRAICYSLPYVDWKEGEAISVSHKPAIDTALTHIDRFDRDVAKNVKKQIARLKAERELISYRAPTMGYRHISARGDFLSLCTLLAEIAQFNSELLEASLLKHGNVESYVYLPGRLTSVFKAEIGDENFLDREDKYRQRRYNRPHNIMVMMSEGHVEDFFGAWHSDEDGKDMFDPDDDWNIIFDIP